MTKRALIYVNQIYHDEETGQAAFERGLIAALRARVERSGDERLFVITVRRDGDSTELPDDSTERLTLRKSSYLGYLAHQLRLLRSILRRARRTPAERVAIYARYNESMFAPALASMLRRCPLTIRTGPIVRDNRRRGRGVLSSVIIGATFRLTCRVASRIVVVTSRIRDWLARDHPRAAPKVEIVPNAVDIERFRPVEPDRALWGLDEDAFTLGYIGALSDDYGLDVILRALRRRRDEGGSRVQLLVVGDGPRLEEWTRLSSELELTGSVVWAGRRSPDDIASAISSCDVMLLPSTASSLEIKGTSSMKLFEYLACDRFVLGSRCDDLAFLEENGVGRLVDAAEAEAWSRAIDDVLTEGRKETAGAARRLVEERYSFSALADRLWEIVFS